MMAALSLRGMGEQMRPLLAVGAMYSRSGTCARSTIAQQRRAGGRTTVGGGPVRRRSLAIRTLEGKAKKLEEQVQDLQANYDRAVAESENVRRRTQKFVADAKSFGIQTFCRDLVEVADVLEKSVEDASQAGKQEMSDTLSVIADKLQKVFIKHGLQKMTPVGGEYDPYSHQIVCHVPVEGLKRGSVAVVKLDGYHIRGRTVRHARVGLAVDKH
ncbi:grpE protein homolog 2, mitochondrial [Hyperolius riggenbachi]|uniref:grpE protein homolog 2, mitochondrial n=1 Tax=Hyperolius riggenbachi TaxID=752182 RepID=UPI0035A31C30